MLKREAFQPSCTHATATVPSPGSPAVTRTVPARLRTWRGVTATV